MSYVPAKTRYENMLYRRCGRSGLKLPAISLGLWQNFGEDQSLERARSICRHAFDRGITHFDLANNYGPPPGAAETAFGRMLVEDFAGHRDELIISSKAGYLMWPGPYGEWGSLKSLHASLDQSLQRMGLDYVNIFYSHRYDPQTPLEETMAALDAAIRQGKTLYVGVSSYNAERTSEAAAILRRLGTPCLIHQPSHSMLNRWIEKDGLLDELDRDGIGCISFSVLAQGLLTEKYLAGIPNDSRAKSNKSLPIGFLSHEIVDRLKGLNGIASRRGQSLAQMAIAWVLRDQRVSSALIGASRVEQLEDCLKALDRLDFDQSELNEIDRFAVDSGINLWAESSK